MRIALVRGGAALWLLAASFQGLPPAADAGTGAGARAEPHAGVSPFGGTPDGDVVSLVTLRNRAGLEVLLMSWGATLVEVRVPDRHGRFDNVNLRLDRLEDYLRGHPLFGSTVGRFANRIDTGGFAIEGVRYDLPNTDPRTKVHIHGGKTGFQRQNWTVRNTWVEGETARALLALRSPDGHEGYPGTLETEARFSLDGNNQLELLYTARTDRPTHVNLTNHVYWNLAGARSGPVLGHRLQLAASQVLEADSRKIPTGRRLPVAGTAFDFRTAHTLGERIGEVAPGYDHCYALDPNRDTAPGFAARLEDPVSGRVLEIRTTAPGIQLYTANHLSPALQHGGHPYGPHHGVCLECQHFPDSPNRPEFPSTLLRPGESYSSRILFRFSVRKD